MASPSLPDCGVSSNCCAGGEEPPLDTEVDVKDAASEWAAATAAASAAVTGEPANATGTSIAVTVGPGATWCCMWSRLS